MTDRIDYDSVEQAERERDALVAELADAHGWEDRSYMHALMHARNAVLNLRADVATAIRERDEARGERDGARAMVRGVTGGLAEASAAVIEVVRERDAALARAEQAERERDEARAKAEQYERDWYDAKSEFGTTADAACASATCAPPTACRGSGARPTPSGGSA